jgi:hypothetical protein
MRTKVLRAAGLGLAIMWAGTVAIADTLVLRNGSRVSGRVISVRDGVIEFEDERANRGRVVRVDQDDVRAIEFDRDDSGRDGFSRDGFGRDGFGAPRPGPGGGDRPRGMRERDVNVSARAAWTNTGIAVRSGQTVFFRASGRVRWGPGRQHGPQGENDSPRNPGRPIPSRPGGALIGRVGDDAPFFIGSAEEGIRVRGSGELLLGINDDFLEDNSGAFRVTVSF